jgi:hypothetical protein
MFFTAPKPAARVEFVEWLRGVLAKPEHAERHADAAIAEHDWNRSLSLEIRGLYTASGNPADYTFHPDDMQVEDLD